nr:NtaA/DmoA family FMN-dependent monooxygenase [Galbitalea soli]
MTVRTLGAWPGAWRLDGAHRDPRADAAALYETASGAERAGIHFLYFGDWLSTSAEFEHTDPYLLSRVDPFAAVSFLAGVTRTIGLVATASSSFAEAYAVARTVASVDLLSGGRVGVAVTSGSEAASASNFGIGLVRGDDDRIAAAAEFVRVLRGLWDSWEDDAFVADRSSGQLIDRSRLHPLAHSGRFFSIAGPLGVARPPQGHPPVAMVGGSPAARELAAQEAELCFVSPRSLDDARLGYAEALRRAADHGRDPRDLVLITSLLPITAPTREGAWAAYDELVDAVAVEPVAGGPVPPGLPGNRTIRSLASAVGVSLSGIHIDEAVPLRVAQRFSPLGRALAATAQERSGRSFGGARPITFRHLLVAHSVGLPVLVGSHRDIADHLEHWYRERATDGFTLLASHAPQLRAFTDSVVPELLRRGIVQPPRAGATLRENLGLGIPSNRHSDRASGALA